MHYGRAYEYGADNQPEGYAVAGTVHIRYEPVQSYMFHFQSDVVRQNFSDDLPDLLREKKKEITEIHYIATHFIVDPRRAVFFFDKFRCVRLGGSDKIKVRVELPSDIFEYQHRLIYEQQVRRDLHPVFQGKMRDNIEVLGEVDVLQFHTVKRLEEIEKVGLELTPELFEIDVIREITQLDILVDQSVKIAAY